MCEFPLMLMQHENPNPELQLHKNYEFLSRVIAFSFLGLEPNDCLSIGYFMANRENYCFMDISCCFIEDIGVELLISQLKQIRTSQRKLSISFGGNILTCNSMNLIGRYLCPLLPGILLLDNCWRPAVTDIRKALKYLLEGLSRSSCFQLGLENCSLTAEHVYYLVLLMTCCSSIDILVLSQNNIGSCMPLIAAALKQNSTLTILIMENCGIGDEELLLLGEALCTFSSGLRVANNPFTSSGLTRFLRKVLNCNLELALLDLDSSLINRLTGAQNLLIPCSCVYSTSQATH